MVFLYLNFKIQVFTIKKELTHSELFFLLPQAKTPNQSTSSSSKTTSSSKIDSLDEKSKISDLEA
ncbi:hypothetical protein SAMN05444484_106202 [Flavobacterium chilense]|uniref:Uncharacterized protein n=1 Tax=Flavobacterium chilense TaxID=946677 RepID=A0A1M7J6R5_9FLAO|nr:hypothetical protein SAMN05444484_106202 [Flavobacterium chilense]